MILLNASVIVKWFVQPAILMMRFDVDRVPGSRQNGPDAGIAANLAIKVPAQLGSDVGPRAMLGLPSPATARRHR